MPTITNDTTEGFRAVPAITTNTDDRALVPCLTSNTNTNTGHDTRIPKIVGHHYHVHRCIGEGSFGVIYEGKSDLNGRKVAIKFVRFFDVYTLLSKTPNNTE